MDIAKIRKKALAEGKQPEVEKRPEPKAAAEPAKETPEPAGTEGVIEEPTRKEVGDSVDKPAATETSSAAASDAGARAAELLTFILDKEEFAFRVYDVEEIIRFQRITLLPTVPDYVLGITSLRGKIIPVIDLRSRLALDKRAAGGQESFELSGDDIADRKEKIIILSGPKGLIGAIIDKVMGVVRLTEDIILEPPPHLTEEETRFIEGVVIVDKRFISIIRAEDAMDIELG